jgi:hypothetical protein
MEPFTSLIALRDLCHRPGEWRTYRDFNLMCSSGNTTFAYYPTIRQNRAMVYLLSNR